MNRRIGVLAAAAAAALAMAPGSMGGAEIIERPPRLPEPSPPVPRFQRIDRGPGPRSNARRKQSAVALKKRRAKIARASRRYNLRNQ